MANRERKIYMLSKKNVDYIEELKEKRDLKYNSEALDLIIREHRTNSDITTEVMINWRKACRAIKSRTIRN